jgi:DNA-binding GntR family transcriptional regulator
MRNRKNEITRTLAARVADGTYKEGDVLPSQIDLAEEFGASHATISAAKWFLTGAGVLVHGGRKGTRIPLGAARAASQLLGQCGCPDRRGV